MRIAPLACSFLLGLTANASAHFHLDAPDNVFVQNGSGDPQKTAPCGGVGTASNAITAVQTGSTITVKITETTFHAGHYRVALAANEAALPAEPTVTGMSCGSAAIQDPPILPVLADGQLKHTTAFSGQQTFTVQLPAGMECDHCVLQVLEFMSAHAPPCFYHHCATVTVSNTAPPPPDAGVTPGGDDASTGGGGGGGTSGGCAAAGGGAGSAMLLVGLALLWRRKRS